MIRINCWVTVFHCFPIFRHTNRSGRILLMSRLQWPQIDLIAVTQGSFAPLLMAPTVLVIAVAAAVQLEIGVVTSSFCQKLSQTVKGGWWWRSQGIFGICSPSHPGSPRFLLESAEGADVDSNSLAFIGKLTGYDSEEYQLSKYYITGATILFACHSANETSKLE